MHANRLPRTSPYFLLVPVSTKTFILVLIHDWLRKFQVDIAFIPFTERFQTFFNEFKNYDITQGRPKLAHWIEEVNKIDAYKVTKRDPKEHVESFMKKFQAAAKP
ncbi:PREDICTED: glutathione S-transferase L3-like [Ipomoea nil]|uniref:glutathione S-transferase L3-like n=1 Tax=Ipomoea nil TaxID=35883 RepID=UPI0009014EFB|nr:PREDICTED: glutathione S-transferase L3-like [Ipomoea nil]